jgi:hypothetical protein
MLLRNKDNDETIYLCIGVIQMQGPPIMSRIQGLSKVVTTTKHKPVKGAPIVFLLPNAMITKEESNKY